MKTFKVDQGPPLGIRRFELFTVELWVIVLIVFI